MRRPLRRTLASAHADTDPVSRARPAAAAGFAGLGALISPLVSTQFAQQKHWSYHYLISAGLYAINTAIIWAVFRGKRQEGASPPPLRMLTQH